MGAGYDIGPCEYLGYTPDGDEDGDGLLNAEEDLDMDGRVDDGETDPNDPDTDGDGLSDLVEMLSGSDPCDPSSSPASIRINFQPSGSAHAQGYCPDSGGSPSPRGYGWLP